MERTKKPTLTLKKNIPAENLSQRNPAPTPNLQDQPPEDFSHFTQEAPTALELNDIEDDYSYYSERKKVRADRRTHRNTPTRNESRWQ